ncbi:MAG TPA: LapA family protein [Acidimicrobiia bacterium]|nr:LapA family protein [Acidimicrobiia bacterium]
MAAEPGHDSGRKVNVKLILLGVLAVILVVFALLNTHEVGVDFVFNTWSAPMILVIAISAVFGFALGFLTRAHLANRSND